MRIRIDCNKMKTFLKDSRFARLFFLIAVSAICLAFLGGSFARYRDSKEAMDGVEPDRFYFASDYLVPDGKTYNVFKDSVTFVVSNTDSGNTTQRDITYTISVDNEGTLVSAGDKTISVGEKTETYTLSGRANQTYTVTAKSTAPYTKTISATFVFCDETHTAYAVEDRGAYSILKLYVGMDTADVTITYGDTLEPDNTNPFMDDWKDDTQNIVTGLERHSYYELVFFEKPGTTHDYTTAKTVAANNAIILN